jgi:hypothetical protein
VRVRKMSNKKVDMRPTLGETLDNYERLSYKIDTAIAEFVDNSTSNYYLYRGLLETKNKNYKLIINIDYSDFNSELKISDNALGMNYEEFSYALKISKRPTKTSGRSEFGMGLKTAASWFTKNWTVVSKRLDENVEYATEIDIEYIKKHNLSEIPIRERKVNTKEHYTIITLKNLKRRLTPANILKLMNELTNIYKKDILIGKIEIYFNGEQLKYSAPKILTFVEDGIEDEKLIEFDDYVYFEGKKLPIKGFFALREVGSYEETGLTLMRHGRVIVGGYKKGFKPKKIFGSANSFVSLRMFGDIEMDGWPVTQAKDDFDWEGSGLKETFIDKIYDISKELADFSKNYREKKDTSVPITRPDLKKFSDSLKEDISKIKSNDIEVPSGQSIEIINNDDLKSYKLLVKISGVEYYVQVSFSNSQEDDLINVLNEDELIKITINSNYPFFESYATDKRLMNILQKLFVLIVLSEQRSSAISSNGNGLIEAKMVRENINLMLRDIIFEEEEYE